LHEVGQQPIVKATAATRVRLEHVESLTHGDHHVGARRVDKRREKGGERIALGACEQAFDGALVVLIVRMLEMSMLCGGCMSVGVVRHMQS
jgi:hypothetical protein